LLAPPADRERSRLLKRGVEQRDTLTTGPFSDLSAVYRRISQTEAEQVFVNRPVVVIGDVAHSGTEARYFSFGRTDGGRLLTVVFTVRGQLLRVISARPMSRSERRGYAKATRP